MTAPSIPQLLFSHWAVALSLDIPLAGTLALYLWGTLRVRGHWPWRRTLAFVAGLGVMAVALQSGLDTYDDRMLSVHMVQHVLLLLPVPLLLLGGRPVMLALRALPRGGRRTLGGAMVVLRPLGHWSVGLTAFYVAVIVPHIPAFSDAALRHPAVHGLEHLLFLGGGLLFLWPIFGAPSGRHALGSVGSLCYVIAAMPSCALVGAYLNRAGGVVYGPYAAAGRSLGISAVTDQQQAGAIMWVGAHLILTVLALWVLGAKLVAEERRQQVRDLIEDRRAVSATGSGGGPP